MPKFEVLSPVNHDGVLYKVGQFIDKEAHKLADLIGLGHIAPCADDPNAEPTDPAARIAAISAAIKNLEPDNGDLWLKDGKPSTEAIAAITGWPVTAVERNGAWESLQTAATPAQEAQPTPDKGAGDAASGG